MKVDLPSMLWAEYEDFGSYEKGTECGKVTLYFGRAVITEVFVPTRYDTEEQQWEVDQAVAKILKKLLQVE